jgi:hypothetical protein
MRREYAGRVRRRHLNPSARLAADDYRAAVCELLALVARLSMVEASSDAHRTLLYTLPRKQVQVVRFRSILFRRFGYNRRLLHAVIKSAVAAPIRQPLPGGGECACDKIVVSVELFTVGQADGWIFYPAAPMQSGT